MIGYKIKYNKVNSCQNQQNLDFNVELLMQNVFSKVQNDKKILKRHFG